MSAGSGVVSVRFDVQGNEQLIAALKTIATSSKGLTTTFTEMQGKLAAPMGGLGPLQGLAAGVGAAETKVTSFRGSLASIGTQLGQNATSFGVATASIWGVYNAYDSLTKVEIRAHSAAVRVSTLETTLASLTERRRIAVEKGNLTGEQLAVLNERIADTQEKLSVAQERSADVAQDVQEAWVGFASQVGPQVVAAGGSIAQLFTTLTTKSPEGISALTKLKTSFAGLFTSLAGAGGGAIGSIPGIFTRIKESVTGTTKSISPLDNVMKSAGGSAGFFAGSLGGIVLPAALAAGAAILIVDQVMQAQQRMEEAGLKFQKFNVLFSPAKDQQKSWDQLDQVLQKTGASMLEMMVAPEKVMQRFKDMGGQIDETTGQIKLMPGALSELGEGFTNTREQYVEWATGLLQSGQKAGQIFDWLAKSGIKQADATEIQIAANEKYQASIAALGISVQRYNELGEKANPIISDYIDRVRSGQVPLDALTESIHGQVQAMVDSKDITLEEGKVLEDLVIKQLKSATAGKAATAAIDQARVKRLQEVSAIKASAAAYLGLDAIQGQSVGQLQVFNEMVGKSVDALVERGLTLRKTADAEKLANDVTFDTVSTNADYIASMINVNKINDKSITSYIALQNARLDGIQAAADFVTQSKLNQVEMINETRALTDFAKKWGLDLPSSMKLTIDQLHRVIDAENLTKTGTLELQKIMDEKLRPSFEHFGDIFAATNWKEFKDSWKELGKSGGLQGVPKDLKSSLKDIGADLIDINKHAKEATNVIDALLVSAASDRQKGTKSGLKALLEDVKSIPGADKIGPFKDAMKDLIALPKDERTKALLNYTDAFAAYKDAIKTDSPGGTIITSGEAENINNLTEAAKNGANPIDTLAGSFDTLSTSASGLANIKLPSWITDPKGFGDAARALNPNSRFAGIGQNTPTPTPEVTPPKPVVFPPPDISNIIAGASKAQIVLGEVVKYAAGLTIAFPLPTIDNIMTGVSKAQMVAGDLVTYIAGLTMAFSEPNTDNVITGVSKAQIAAGSVPPYIAGLTMAFPGVNIVAVANSTSSAKKAAATLVTDIKALKPAFPGVNIVGVVNSTSSAKKAASTLVGHIAGLQLKFPGINISNITSSVNSAQSKIDSLHGTTVTNHVKTVFDNAGGNILNNAMITSAAMGKLFTTNGEQLFRVGDNPGGRETIAMIPHDKPNEIMEKLNKMFPPIISTLHERARRPSMQTVSGHAMSTRTSAGPTQVNVTTQVYLFPGSQMFKQYVKQIMLEDLSRYASA